ncbi:MAG: hypothetical protein IK102_05410 [Treponema sp.]|nr:hypothetical protein [Treponema sp.]
MLKKLLITGGISLVVYVINYMRKEYDKNVEDYNNLVDKCNEMSDFINDCDFYRYHDSEDSVQKNLDDSYILTLIAEPLTGNEITLFDIFEALGHIDIADHYQSFEENIKELIKEESYN